MCEAFCIEETCPAFGHIDTKNILINFFDKLNLNSTELWGCLSPNPFKVFYSSVPLSNYFRGCEASDNCLFEQRRVFSKFYVNILFSALYLYPIRHLNLNLSGKFE